MNKLLVMNELLIMNQLGRCTANNNAEGNDSLHTFTRPSFNRQPKAYVAAAPDNAFAYACS